MPAYKNKIGIRMANSDLDTHITSAKDVKQLGIGAALGRLSYVFWICGTTMRIIALVDEAEIIERIR